MDAIKFFIGPMSKNVVDAIMEFYEETGNLVGLIPSRRQVEWNGGYANNWTTEQFCNYANILPLQRDHAGPDQGITDDDGYESLAHDAKSFDLIHIDPWKKYPDFAEGLKWTANMIEHCDRINSKLLYEIGTEEAIRPFEASELERLIIALKYELTPAVFDKIKYLVIQSGTSLKGTNQTGNYDPKRLKDMITVARKYRLLSKEHNGDYLSLDLIKDKFKLGLNSINIAPEFGLIETTTYLNEIKDEKIFDRFWQICYDSKKWIKWVSSSFDPYYNKEQLIKICGHYVLSQQDFIQDVKANLPELDKKIKANIKLKLNELHGS
jgi:uncharacterized protein YlbG (UPF0298 family)